MTAWPLPQSRLLIPRSTSRRGDGAGFRCRYGCSWRCLGSSQSLAHCGLVQESTGSERRSERFSTPAELWILNPKNTLGV